jgi:hypothetical protein
MGVTVQQVTGTIEEVGTIANEILDTFAGLDPAAALPIGIAETIEALAIKALKAWSASSGTPITVDSVLALMPDQTPLTPPAI